MLDALKWAIGGIIAVAIATALAIYVLGLNRVTLPFAEETRRQVYDNSRAYQQGTQLALARYCSEWRRAAPEHRDALAQVIRETAASYSGPLSADNQSCLGEVQ